MNQGANREALGDWSNLKGSRYHLVYAIWLILRNQANKVHFYEGNDLLASPVVPLAIPDSASPSVVPLAASVEAEDLWIQLKCTREPWTVTNLLAENLLYNFICNSFVSESHGRRWRVLLVTEGVVRRDEILEFANGPASKPNLNVCLESIVAKASGALATPAGPAPSTPQIKDRALEILRELAKTQPVSLETLKAQVETELTLACPDRNRTRRLASLLIGAMLEDAAEGPGRARTYDASWVNEVTGTGIKSSKPFDTDVLLACDVALADVAMRRFSPPYSEARHAPRAGLLQRLGRFLSAPETVFLLTGSSGSGRVRRLPTGP
jgi:hypothetical protein